MNFDDPGTLRELALRLLLLTGYIGIYRRLILSLAVYKRLLVVPNTFTFVNS